MTKFLLFSLQELPYYVRCFFVEVPHDFIELLLPVHSRLLSLSVKHRVLILSIKLVFSCHPPYAYVFLIIGTVLSKAKTRVMLSIITSCIKMRSWMYSFKTMRLQRLSVHYKGLTTFLIRQKSLWHLIIFIVAY